MRDVFYLKKKMIAVSFLLGVILLISGGAHAAKYVLKAGTDQPRGHSYVQGFDYLAKRVDELTGGQVKIDIFPGATLGDEVSLLEGLRMGTVDICCAAAPNASTIVPDFNMFSASYLFTSYDHFSRVLTNQQFVEKMKDMIRKRDVGIEFMGLYTCGVRNLYNRLRPVYTPEDVKGMKIRVMAAPIEAKMWKAYGTIPISIPTPETYSAIQQGVADGAENSPITVLSYKHYEPAPYYSITEHEYLLAPLLMSSKTYKKLPENLRNAVMQAGLEAAAVQRKADVQANKDALEKMIELGVKVNFANRKSFKAKVENLHQEIAKEYGLTDLLDLIRQEAN
jgi:tripartite ATP-independent transporter DctP family solute receptor